MESLRAFGRFLLDVLLPVQARERRLRALTTDDLAQKMLPQDAASGREIMFLFNYRDALVRDALLALKFNDNHRMAALFAEALNDFLLEALGDRALFSNDTAVLLIPIPLSAKRLRERGYNQSELVARELAELSGGAFELAPEALYRTRHTAPQSSIGSKAKRAQNVRGAFRVPLPERVSGRAVMVLDDITTSGSTLREARSALRAAGAKSVWCIAIAH